MAAQAARKSVAVTPSIPLSFFPQAVFMSAKGEAKVVVQKKNRDHKGDRMNRHQGALRRRMMMGAAALWAPLVMGTSVHDEPLANPNNQETTS